MKYLIIMAGASFILASCGSQPPVHNSYSYRIYESQPSSSSPSKIGGGGSRNAGGSDSPEQFRAMTSPN